MEAIETKQDIHDDGVKMLMLLRSLGTEEQRIAFALLEGMKLQKNLDAQHIKKKEAAG
jgi:hypothetical protein